MSNKSKKSRAKEQEAAPTEAMRKVIQNAVNEVRRQVAVNRQETESLEYKDIKEMIDKLLLPCNHTVINSIQCGLQEMKVLKAKLEEVHKERNYQMKVFQDKIDDLQKQMRVIRKTNALRGYCGD
jgi:hypothetical protein